MSQKLPWYGFKWIKKFSELDKHFIRNDDENNDKGYILEVDVQYPKNLFNLHNDLAHLPEKKKIKKCKKLVCNIHSKENYVVLIRALKQVLNHELILKKINKVIQFNQKAWLKPYIDMNTKLRTDAKMTLKKISLN